MKTNFLKNTLWASLTALALTACGGDKPADTAAADSNMADAKTVAITAIVEHPALDAARTGALEQLAAEGFKEGENLTVNFQSAQGNMATAGQIAKQFVSDNPDVIYAIATPSAQAIAAATSDLPIVFSAVTDPVEAKLVTSLEKPDGNITGASDVLPYEPQIELIRELVPNVKNVGYVYSPGEVNSTIVLKNLKEKLAPLGINVIEAPAQKSSDITQAANSLVGKVDVFYTSTDNMVVNAYEAIYQVAVNAKIPLIASNTEAVERGAVAALGVNYTDLGKQSGKIIARILKGEKPANIPVYVSKNLDLHVSPKHAAEQGIELPQSVLDRAAKIVE
ncbi:ABC transporter substrate-binding protein [Moraxella marmotae]|uniref:ABC transporter substrate-binding protein n=1 Tax=Moraxella marmotae TaxID=3344520 RepID=UPI0035F25719